MGHPVLLRKCFFWFLCHFDYFYLYPWRTIPLLFVDTKLYNHSDHEYANVDSGLKSCSEWPCACSPMTGHNTKAKHRPSCASLCCFSNLLRFFSFLKKLRNIIIFPRNERGSFLVCPKSAEQSLYLDLFPLLENDRHDRRMRRKDDHLDPSIK